MSLKSVLTVGVVMLCRRWALGAYGKFGGLAFGGARKVVVLGKDDAAMDACLLSFASFAGSGKLGLIESVSVRVGTLRFLGGWFHANGGIVRSSAGMFPL